MTAELSSQCYPYLSGLPPCYCCSPYDFNGASKENLKDKSLGYINKWLYNHNKTKQNTTMCIYCGIYCANRHSTTQCYKVNCLHPVKYVCVCSMQCPWCGGRILYHRHSDLLLCRGVLWLLWRVSLSDTPAGDRCVHPRRDGKISDLLSVSSTHRGYSTCGMSNERRRCPLEWHQRPIWMR